MEIGCSAHPLFRSISVDDLSQPGEARRAASLMATELGFDDVKRGEVEIIVTELARNIVVHGSGGHLLLAAWKEGSQKRMDIIAIDKGPGVANVSAALEDGFSTAGTAGTGLGAVSRLASTFEIFTRTKLGTAVLARVSVGAKQQSPLAMGGLSVPMPNETSCGDAFATAHSSSRSVCMLVDGSGHGPQAAEAAAEALSVFEKYHSDSPAEIMDRLHSALKGTRGAAAAVAEIQHHSDTVVYCGIGNIAGLVVQADTDLTRNMLSQNGVVGHQVEQLTEFTYPWFSDSAMILHSDGLDRQWNLEAYPGLINKDPALIAAVLYRDHNRSRDDASVLVALARGAPARGTDA
jgi:anti-sigma regulatory factor (Ser/Thr protein kinase)